MLNDIVQEIYTDEIDLPKENMREHIDRDGIDELAADIKKNGLISPIIVRPKEKRYELVAGQRRYLAHQVAGIIRIKAIVRVLTDEEAFAIMTSENLAREDVNPVDEAKHVVRLLAVKDGDIDEVSHIVNRGRQWVEDRIEIASMPGYLQEHLRNGTIKLGVAIILNQIKHDELRSEWVSLAVRDGTSIAQAKYWLSDYQRQLLPGGRLHGETQGDTIYRPPEAIMFKCSIDGQEYDTRMLKSITIYEGNMKYFSAFVEAFRSDPAEIESSPGGSPVEPSR